MGHILLMHTCRFVYLPAIYADAFCCVQNINILTLGNPQGKGVFFPEGLLGNITTPYGYNMSDPGNETFPTSSDNSGKLDTQVARCLVPPCAACSVLTLMHSSVEH